MEEETMENFEKISSTPDETLQTIDPVQNELNRVRPQRTEEEKAIFTYKKQQERLRQLGIDPSLIDGGKSQDGDDAPLTVGMFKQIKAQEAKQTAKQLAQKIENTAERELVEHYLDNRIIPSGNPEEDLRIALAAVNSVRNSQIAQMASSKPTPQSHSNAGGMPNMPQAEPLNDLNETERFLKSTGLATDEDIRKARETARINPFGL